ncbi:hypothetical protein SLS62_006727 [Diatrype stigma]|uniref:Uncharacterized protein n=1 Tax=Diatrype stigma TaxID=117547 RepID=A0AAN9UQG5_9PEZI
MPDLPPSAPEPTSSKAESSNDSTLTAISASASGRHPKCPVSRIYHKKRELLVLLGFVLLVATFCGTGAGLAIVAGVQGTPNHDRKSDWMRGHGLLALGLVCGVVHFVTMLLLTGLAARDARRKARRTLPWVGAAFGSCAVALVILIEEGLRRWGWDNWAAVWLLVCAGWLVCMGLECATGLWYLVFHRVARCCPRFRFRSRFRSRGDEAPVAGLRRIEGEGA